MTNGTTFKKITNEDIYNKLISIENIALNNKIQLRYVWAMLLILFTTLIGLFIEKIIGG